MALDAIKTPGVLNFTIIRGDSFRRELTIKQDGSAIDLTGYTVSSQIRDTAGGNLLETWTSNILAPDTDGKIEILLSTSQTRGLPTNAVWDLQVVLTADPTNNTNTLIQGAIKVVDDVTVL